MLLQTVGWPRELSLTQTRLPPSRVAENEIGLRRPAAAFITFDDPDAKRKVRLVCVIHLGANPSEHVTPLLTYAFDRYGDMWR